MEENHCKLNELLLETSNLGDSYTHILLTGDYNFPDINWDSWTAKEKLSSNFLESIKRLLFPTNGRSTNKIQNKPRIINIRFNIGK